MRQILLKFLVILGLPALAVADPYDDLAKVEILPGWRMQSGIHMAGIRITLAPGWKTYWRAPGDAGIPPQFSFAGSGNIVGVTPHWPVPHVFYENGLQSIGYYDSVVFPLAIQSRDPDEDIEIDGVLTIGVCEEICIPVSATFDALLPSAGERDSAITAALINQPLSAAEAGVGEVICQIAPIQDGLKVTTTMEVGSTGGSEVVVVESGNPAIWVSEADVTRVGDALQATVDMVNTTGEAFALDRSALRFTVLGSEQAIDIQGCRAG
ncbi:protein-disulfide reductase DsbD domain-containing protein [Yoonia sp. 2307UL14-13]|uniref:protein-disulfide reductase DsbD domain-containing protein n=1 Tax=Yoonia sp. 2307UL14-13 TaxID=3126506 RepID=UPI0030B143DE